MRRFLRIAVLFACSLPILFGVGCHDNDSPTAPRRGDVLILRSIAPPSGTLIPRGQSTRFEGVFRYEFATAARGRLVVLILASWRSAFDIDVRTLRQLDSPTGEVSVSVDVAVPATAAGGTLSLTFSIVPEGASERSASASAHYGVVS